MQKSMRRINESRIVENKSTDTQSQRCQQRARLRNKRQKHKIDSRKRTKSPEKPTDAQHRRSTQPLLLPSLRPLNLVPPLPLPLAYPSICSNRNRRPRVSLPPRFFAAMKKKDETLPTFPSTSAEAKEAIAGSSSSSSSSSCLLLLLLRHPPTAAAADH